MGPQEIAARLWRPMNNERSDLLRDLYGECDDAAWLLYVAAADNEPFQRDR